VHGRRKLGALRLVHVDHRLQAASAQWSRHCARQARAWRVPFTSLRVTVEIARGDSPEAAARAARYAALEGVLEAGEVLVTAQHRDDQVETLLLQLFRGAGVAGLAAMPSIAPFGAGRIARPLLETPRASLLDHARKHRLDWIDDPSNADSRFARNFLRREILPAIRARWPGVDPAIARSARHMAEAQRLLSALARADLARVADGAALRVAGLKALPPARRSNALREFIRGAEIQAPSASKTLQIAHHLLAVRPDAQPEVRWQGGVMRRRAGRLELDVTSEVSARTPPENPPKTWRWAEKRECNVNEAGDRLRLVADSRGPIDRDALPRVVTIRARAGGETLRPAARARTQSLKKLLQAAGLSVEERARLPLLFSGDRLIAAGDRWIDASIAANDKSRRRARLVWTRAR
jgi:tRNA(Ile)-lysidine synthase